MNHFPDWSGDYGEPFGERPDEYGFKGHTIGYKHKPELECFITVYEKDPEEENSKLLYVTISNKDLATALRLLKDIRIDHNYIPSKEILEDVRLPYNKEVVDRIFIKKGRIPTKRTFSRNVATCAFGATSSYMEHMLGMKLDDSDRSWYSLNSLVTPDGLPQENTFTVLEQLVEPYGLGISHIQVPRNSRRFPLHSTFVNALGANPLFKTNGNTTNEEAYDILYPKAAREALIKAKGFNSEAKHKAHVFSTWMFECTDTPKLPAVVMIQHNLTSAGHNGGSSYYGPRTRHIDNDKWLMGIRFDRKQFCQRMKDLEMPEYKLYEGSEDYDWWRIQSEGKSLGQIFDDHKKRTPFLLPSSMQKQSKFISKFNEPIGNQFPGTDKNWREEVSKSKEDWIQDLLNQQGL